MNEALWYPCSNPIFTYAVICIIQFTSVLSSKSSAYHLNQVRRNLQKVAESFISNMIISLIFFKIIFFPVVHFNAFCSLLV